MQRRPAQAFRPNKGSWSRPLADLIGAAIDPVLARQGFGQSDLILYWDDIVGERLAANSQPIKLQWPRAKGSWRDPDNAGAPDAATLVVRVESGFALEMQHLSGAVIDRVNAHLGWRCVARLTLKQGPIERRPAGRPARPPPDPALAAQAANAVAGVADAPLREALARLGARVLASREPDRRAGVNAKT